MRQQAGYLVCHDRPVRSDRQESHALPVHNAKARGNLLHSIAAVPVWLCLHDVTWSLTDKCIYLALIQFRVMQTYRRPLIVSTRGRPAKRVSVKSQLACVTTR
jgi:hypothetical protein